MQENEKGAGVMKLLRCCKLNVLQWRIQPKYFLCVVFLTLHMWNLLHGLNDYATALGYRIHPWIFPFLPDTNWNFTVMLLLFVLMVVALPHTVRLDDVQTCRWRG